MLEWLMGGGITPGFLGEYVLKQTVLDDNPYFGYSVAMSTDGSVLGVGTLSATSYQILPRPAKQITSYFKPYPVSTVWVIPALCLTTVPYWP